MSKRRPGPISFTSPERHPEPKARVPGASWYRIDNSAANGVPAVYLHDDIGDFGVTSGDFVAALAELGAEAFDLHINSRGGSVWDGVAIYNAIQQHPATVTARIDGIAASAASLVACAADRVVMAKTATMMIHDALCLTIGNAAELRAEADLLDKISEQIAGVYADKSGRSAYDMRALMLAETWFNADEAVAAGLADEIAGPPAKSVPMNTWDLSIFNFAGRDNAPPPALPAVEPAVITDALPAEPTAPTWPEIAAAYVSALKEAQ